MPTPTDSRETACVFPVEPRTYPPQNDIAIVLRHEPSGLETFARWVVVDTFQGRSVKVRAHKWLSEHGIPGRNYQVCDEAEYKLLTGRWW